MKAVGLYKYLPIDDAESFVDVDVPPPVPSDRDLLVRVAGYSDYFVDLTVDLQNEIIKRTEQVAC